jgi:hypothetical protein
MKLTTAFRSTLTARALVSLLVVLAGLWSQANQAHATAFSKNNFATGGDPKTAAYPNANSNFFRWEQSQITYAFAPSFVSAYGVPGQNRVTTDFGLWTAGIAAAAAPADQSAPYNPVNDIPILGQTNTYDFQSVALHEIGHSIGFDHPDIDPNYNVAAGDWAAGALPAANHPVMWHNIAPILDRQVLTIDDVQGDQFLYSQVAAGAGKGPAGGPVFGNTARGLTFNQIAYNPAGLPDILIEAAVLPAGTLGQTFLRPGGVFTPVAGFTYKLATNATFMDIQFPVPEPSSIVLAVLGVVAFVLFPRSRRRAA